MFTANPSKSCLQTASDFFDKRTTGTTTLLVMERGEDRKAAVGRRIRDCAEERGLGDPAALHQAIVKILTDDERNKGSGQTVTRPVTRQTVSNWWYGKVYPSLEWLPVLASVLETDQELILFGSRRGDQLKKERQYLARVSEEELALLTSFRESSKSGQKTIVKLVRGVAEEHPAPEASVHQLRRKDDKRKT